MLKRGNRLFDRRDSASERKLRSRELDGKSNSILSDPGSLVAGDAIALDLNVANK